MKVYDDFMDKGSFKKLQYLMLESSEFAWYISNGVVAPIDQNTDFLQNYQFTHLFYDALQPTSEHFELLLPVFRKIKPSAIIRIKANLNPVTEKHITYDKHLDFPGLNNKTAILYMNTNNGYSMIDGEKIDSVENRMVVFDGQTLHTGTTCTDQKYRCLINFNYF